MTKCGHCGKDINHVMVNFFNHEGQDSFIPCEFSEYENNAIELDVDHNWTGDELTDEEAKETIVCPYCGKFPFDEKEELQVYEIVRLVMFRKEG